MESPPAVTSHPPTQRPLDAVPTVARPRTRHKRYLSSSVPVGVSGLLYPTSCVLTRSLVISDPVARSTPCRLANVDDWRAGPRAPAGYRPDRAGGEGLAASGPPGRRGGRAAVVRVARQGRRLHAQSRGIGVAKRLLGSRVYLPEYLSVYLPESPPHERAVNSGCARRRDGAQQRTRR